MAPRKRTTEKKTASQVHAEDVIKAAKVKAAQTSIGKQSSSPMFIICVVLVVGTVSAGLYIYNFVDVENLMDKFEEQVYILRGEKKIPVPDKSSASKQTEDNKNKVKKEANKQVEKNEKEVNVKKITERGVKENQKDVNIEKQTDKQKEDTPKETKENESKINEKKSEKEIKPKYSKSDVTNKADNKIRSELDRADGLADQKNPSDAIRIFNNILKKYPKSPRAIYGKAKALCVEAEMKRSNEILEQCIDEYVKMLDLPDVPKSLMLQAGKECVDKQQFRGWSGRAAKTLKRLIELYPDNSQLWNDLGVQYLVTGKNEDARQAFKHVLRSKPDDGFAKVHLGFIIKTVDVNNEGAIPYLREGIASGAEGVTDGRFFFHLGDALYRIGKHNEAYSVYQSGADKGLFMSLYQRSLYNVESLTGRPWWTLEQTGHAAELKNFEKNWKIIRDEGLAQLNAKTGSFLPEEENLREKGDWKQFTLFQKGRKMESNCKKVPKTCALIEKIPDAAGCKRGQVKFSVMKPGVHVWPHCGPTNCRIRAHLGLVIPEGPVIRVADDKRKWKEGEFIIFDDSFEHEVWHDGNQTRLVLIVDLWHPELTTQQKQQLTPI